ncbi:MAG TPA: hypothetical protein VF516_27680, partial [Kofleriaceae bacterium]
MTDRTALGRLSTQLEKAMKLLAKLGLLGAFGLWVGGATVTAVYGDPPGDPGPPISPSGQSGGASAAGTGASASVDLRGTLPAADVRARVQILHDQIRADARHIQHLQQVARQEKDVIKLNCVNDKLVQAKPQMNIADLKEQELESAGDAERMAAFETISQAADSLRKLREESDQCIGEPITFSGGESSNSFTGP